MILTMMIMMTDANGDDSDDDDGTDDKRGRYRQTDRRIGIQTVLPID